MTRELSVIDAGDARAVFAALRDALTGDGPAVLPRQHVGVPGGGHEDASVPASVPRNVALVVETSGSTGAPKRVALSADALLASAAASAGSIGGQEPGSARWLLALPAHYIAGANVLVRSIAAGTEPVILPPGHFDPAAFCAAADALDADQRFTSLVPVQLARLLDAALDASVLGDSAMLTTLRRFDALLIGGQALQPDLRDRALDAGLRIVRTYGSSETCGGCVYDGVPIGTVVARECDGRIELSGPVLAVGYLDATGGIDRDRTDATFHVADGTRWYRTGDLGAVDAAGRVRVTGRADNVIISGGEKVSLDAVQASVRRVQGYAEAIVVATKHVEWGQAPVVVVAGEPPLPLAELRAAVQAELGHAAAPDRVVVVQSMPLLASGKPDRIALTALVSGTSAA
ncbi:AMP-binding protein [Humibacter ginsenosidimutans]|uniref:AMP-binding protein n=1 Tax=Humibacter ginsenosidimutans TaxID=2599293 RepID=UPI00143D4017|nr:AMP-binding protein [Humibacter ginsenosidimutans]